MQGFNNTVENGINLSFCFCEWPVWVRVKLRMGQKISQGHAAEISMTHIHFNFKQSFHKSYLKVWLYNTPIQRQLNTPEGEDHIKNLLKMTFWYLHQLVHAATYKPSASSSSSRNTSAILALSFSMRIAAFWSKRQILVRGEGRFLSVNVSTFISNISNFLSSEM